MLLLAFYFIAGLFAMKAAILSAVRLLICRRIRWDMTAADLRVALYSHNVLHHTSQLRSLSIIIPPPPKKKKGE